MVVGAVVHSEYSNINIWLLVVFKTLFGITKMISKSRKFPLQVGICYILPHNQIIKRNNQIVKMNNQIFRIKMARIHSRLACVSSNNSVHNRKIAAHILKTIEQLKKEYQNPVIPMRET